MNRERVTRKSQNALAGAWISNTDVMFTGLILTLVVTITVGSRLQRAETDERELRAAYEESTVDLRLTRQQLTELAEVEADREQLVNTKRQQLDDLQAEVQSLRHGHAVEIRRHELEHERQVRVNHQLQAQNHEHEAQNRQLEAQNREFGVRMAAYQNHVRELTGRMERSVAEHRQTSARLDAAVTQLGAARRETAMLRETAPVVHRELLGLRGKMQRVAILFDTSGSMQTGDRWDHARDVVKCWLEHLAIRECVLILFASEVTVYPPGGHFLDVQGTNGASNRARLVQQIEQATPGGRTNTLAALKTAYRYADLDTIILFTDGEPNSPTGRDQFESEMAELIYELCRQYSVPVNAVGLGDYFKPELSRFLLTVSQETGGSFVGR